jgi:hypothetical protein
MSEDNIDDTTGAAPAGDTSAPADGQASKSQSLAETGVSDTGSTGSTGDAGTQTDNSKAAWPENWRDQLAGSDDKLKGLLGRYTTPDAFAKAFKELRTAYDSRKPAKGEDPGELPENPTDEQLAAYRKAKGVPDKPEDYEFEIQQDRELGDNEYEIFMDFAKAMHGQNVPKDIVKGISSWFLDYQEVVAQKAADIAYNARQETEEKLRAEWGGDYRANVNLMSNVLQEHLGSEANAFLSKTFTDGSRLGDNETFVRLMAEISRKVGGSSAELYTTDVNTSGKGLETRRAELMKMMNDPDPQVRKKYWAPEVQSEMQRIQSAIIRRQA